MNHSPITSQKATPQTINSFKYFVSIDKLTLNLRDLNIPRNHLLNWLKNNALVVSEGSFKNESGRVNIQISHPNNAKSFIKTLGINGKPTSLIFNPSQFTGACQCTDQLQKILPIDILGKASISRLDLTIDILGSFEEVLDSIDVLYKRTSNHSSYKGSKLDFVSFGKRSSGEFIKLYDKSYNLDGHGHITRLEIQLTNPKLKEISSRNPLEVFSELNSQAFHNHQKNPFKKVSFIKVKHHKPLSSFYEKKQIRFQGSNDIVPYCIARRRLNTHGNFKRNYKKIISTEKLPLQPSVIFQLGIREWLQKGYKNEKEIN